MNNSMCRFLVGLSAVLLATVMGCERAPSPDSRKSTNGGAKPAATVQLNWLHDPTFVAQYQLGKSTALRVTVREGGPNVSPLAEVLARRAQFAIVGADIFLKYLGENPSRAGKSELVCVFVDFQRNPVGWVLHPDVAKELGLQDAVRSDAKKLNKWVAEQIRANRIKVGDKRGTESTSAWLQWRAKQSLSPEIPLVPVGFDPTIVLSAPKMLYPVYLNEQPFKLSERTNADGKGDVVVVDPVVDGVSLLGNVIVARRDLVETNLSLVETFQQEVRRAWESVRSDPEKAAEEVRIRYTGVSAQTVSRQVRRTVDFVFADGSVPGKMDLAKDGMWVLTLRALQDAGTVSRDLTPEQVFGALVPPK